MKLTPENIVEAAAITFGADWLDHEPPLDEGQSVFSRNLVAMQADQCCRCGSWWECDEVIGHDDLGADDLYCIECADELSGFGVEQTWREREAFEAIHSELRRRVTCRTIEDARADRDRIFAALAEVCV